MFSKEAITIDQQAAVLSEPDRPNYLGLSIGRSGGHYNIHMKKRTSWFVLIFPKRSPMSQEKVV
ncbi:MAG: hypothetical protein KKG06_04430 [Bacteroidetes bacterium]|nr:hypothetical protein [Bacteroidota bacterium]